MNTTIKIIEALDRRDIAVRSVEFQTPDGRHWAIRPVLPGRGRRPDGSWGVTTPDAPGGFRLFEIDPEERRGPQEHDAVESDVWQVSELIDYLDAVGRPRPRPR